jgi:large subunit ribosomal protein L30
MTMLKVTQVRSAIGRPPKQRGTLRALGLRRINHTVIKEDRPEIRGMLVVVSHLVEVEEVPQPRKRGARKDKSASTDVATSQKG